MKEHDSGEIPRWINQSRNAGVVRDKLHNTRAQRSDTTEERSEGKCSKRGARVAFVRVEFYPN